VYRLVPVLYNKRSPLIFQREFVAVLRENLCVGPTKIYVVKKYLRAETENFLETCLRSFYDRPSERFAVTACPGSTATRKYATSFRQSLATQSLLQYTLQCLLLSPSSAPICNHYKLIIANLHHQQQHLESGTVHNNIPDRYSVMVHRPSYVKPVFLKGALLLRKSDTMQ
jgi:hypothetical protein